MVEHLVRLFDEQPADPVTGARGIGISALVAAIYVGVPEQLHPVALYSVWAHLQKLAQGGCVETTDRDDITSRWWPAPHLLKS